MTFSLYGVCTDAPMTIGRESPGRGPEGHGGLSPDFLFCLSPLLTLLCGCISHFPCYDKTPSKSNLRRKGFLQATVNQGREDTAGARGSGLITSGQEAENGEHGCPACFLLFI